jgi:TIR domain
VAKRVKRIFISYASADKVTAETITDALEAAGMRCYASSAPSQA